MEDYQLNNRMTSIVGTAVFPLSLRQLRLAADAVILPVAAGDRSR